MAYAAAAMAVVGMVANTYSQAKSADVQAKALDAEARTVEDSTKFEEAQQRRKNKIVMGQANAIGAASGLDITQGSTLFMELDRAKQSEIDAQSIRRTGSMHAAGLRFQSKLSRKSIPWTILGASGQAGSILSQYKAAD